MFKQERAGAWAVKNKIKTEANVWKKRLRMCGCFFLSTLKKKKKKKLIQCSFKWFSYIFLCLWSSIDYFESVVENIQNEAHTITNYNKRFQEKNVNKKKIIQSSKIDFTTFVEHTRCNLISLI